VASAVSKEYEMMSKEVGVAEFEVVSRHLLDRTNGNDG